LAVLLVLVRLLVVGVRPLRVAVQVPVVVLVELQLFAPLADTRVAAETAQTLTIRLLAVVAVSLLWSGK
jgi:hypothetical protein